MELMVVVLLIALLAVLASPSFSEARNDKIAFDYARQFQQVLVQGRSRAAGTGSAHLALLGPGSANRGFVRLYAALDGLDGYPATDPGPNPVSSCKQNPTQWDQTQTDPLNYTGKTARFIDFADLNRGGVNADMDVKAKFQIGDGTATTTAAATFLAICITPSGVTYVGDGNTAANAIAKMRLASPFNGVAEVLIQRNSGGSGVGLQRRVVITGGGAPRVRSQ